MVRFYCDGCGKPIDVQHMLCEQCGHSTKPLIPIIKEPWDDRADILEKLKQVEKERDMFRRDYEAALEEIDRLQENKIFKRLMDAQKEIKRVIKEKDEKVYEAKRSVSVETAKNQYYEDQDFRNKVLTYVIRKQRLYDITSDEAWEKVKKDLEKRMNMKEDDDNDDQ